MHQRHRTVVFFIGLLGFVLLQRSAAWAGPKPREKTLVVQDFEAKELANFVMPNKLKGERYALGKKRMGHAYRCTASGGESVCWLSLLNVPKDVTPYRMLRFRIRGKSASPHPFYVLLLNKPRSYGLSDRVSGLTDKWKTVDLLLPTMHREDGFDPKSVLRIQFVWFQPPAFSFEIDDIQFVKIKAGGWQYSDKELLVDTFGKKRAKKVKHHQTKHFDIYTDSSAAKSKFPKALEETYDFVRARLGVPEFKDRLPVYIHQNSKLYHDFCVRYVGWSRRSAENSAGHGSGRYMGARLSRGSDPRLAG